MVDDRHDQAIGVLVERIIADAALRAIEGEHIGWEDFPDIGEHDWQRIASGALDECTDTINRGRGGYEAAYQYLASLADRETA